MELSLLLDLGSRLEVQVGRTFNVELVVYVCSGSELMFFDVSLMIVMGDEVFSAAIRLANS